MKNINNYIQEKFVINKNTKLNKDSFKYTIDDFDEDDFLNALNDYGEFEYEDILMALDGNPLYIGNSKVMSLLDDDGLKYSYKGKNNIEVEVPLVFDRLDDETLEKLYNYLMDNIGN